jgi:hypothetical protein
LRYFSLLPPPHVCWPRQSQRSTAPAKSGEAIPWSQIGAKAGADYKGDGLFVTRAENGARLLCVFQQLEGRATLEGLWLTSTVTNMVNERFRATAFSVGRAINAGASKPFAPFTPTNFEAPPGFGVRQSAGAFGLSAARKRQGTAAVQDAIAPKQALARTGTVEIADKVARFIRPGLTEEYSVSMDGVRQDFIIEQRPVGAGALRVELDVSGAKVEPLSDGVQLLM